MRIVIVGAGSSGCVLSNRLSASGQHHVTLIEAGPDYAPAALPVDLADGRQNSLSAHDWGFKHRVNSKQRVKFPLPRGRVVGGSSAVNTCIALRGQPEDYDEWAARGLAGWGWDDVLPSFRRLERDLQYGDRPWHGDSGPMPLTRYAESAWTPWQAAFVAAAREVGYDPCPDTNEPGRFGVGPHTMNCVDGRRISAAEAYLTPDVRAREAFTLMPGTEAVRVLFDGLRVTGLEVVRGEQIEVLPADRVVLCAGSLLTPLVLLRSGIGRRDDLEAHNLETVVVNENVGARLLDHPGCAMFFRPKRGVVRRDYPLIQTALRVSSGVTGVPGDILIQPGSKVPFPEKALPLCSMMVSIGKPSGTGTLRYKSIRPGRVQLDVRSALLDHDGDRAMAVAAMERIAEIAAQDSARACATHLYPMARTVRSADRIDAWVRKSTDSGYHPSGTVPMGADDDPSAACTGHGRVRGVEGLYVGDASLMPTIPSANIHLATLMVAERLAEMWGGAPGG